jgi:PAS domain S-box-containing protein
MSPGDIHPVILDSSHGDTTGVQPGSAPDQRIGLLPNTHPGERDDPVAKKTARATPRLPSDPSAILDRISDAFFALDEEWRFTYVNHQAERGFRKSRDELLGRVIWELFPEAVGTAIDDGYRRALAEQTPVSFSTYYAPFDIWVEIHAYPSEEGLTVLFTDITANRSVARERENLLTRLGVESARWRATAESMLDLLTVCDAEGRVTYINPAYTRLIGRLPDPNLPLESHSDYYQLYHPDGTPFDPRDLPLQRAALSGESVTGVEIVHRAADGREVIGLFNATPLRDENGNVVGAVAVGRDVTDERRTTAEREALVAELERVNAELRTASEQAKGQADGAKRQAERLSQLHLRQEDYIHAIGHDLRNPLTGILGHAQLMQRYPEKTDLIDKCASIIEASARQMSRMIMDLVDSARLESGQIALNLAPIDVASYLFEAKDRLAGTEDAARVRLEVSSSLPPVRADTDRLDRILMNLLGNALKYSTYPARVTLSAEVEGNEVRISVRDQGTGIPPEDLPRVFDRYFRAGQARTIYHEGLGLGLFITKGLVEAHGGRIWAESTPGVGSTFTFTLPIPRFSGPD